MTTRCHNAEDRDMKIIECFTGIFVVPSSVSRFGTEFLFWKGDMSLPVQCAHDTWQVEKQEKERWTENEFVTELKRRSVCLVCSGTVFVLKRHFRTLKGR